MIRLIKYCQLFNIILIIVIIGILSLCGCTNMRHRLGTIKMLKGLSSNDKYKEKALKQETMNFEKAKKYINRGGQEKGISQKTAIKKFGRPVLILSEAEGEKWVYKPADAGWLGGEKIYLFFDRDRRLVNRECVDLHCPPFEE